MIDLATIDIVHIGEKKRMGEKVEHENCHTVLQTKTKLWGWLNCHQADEGEKGGVIFSGGSPLTTVIQYEKAWLCISKHDYIVAY